MPDINMEIADIVAIDFLRISISKYDLFSLNFREKCGDNIHLEGFTKGELEKLHKKLTNFLGEINE